MSSAVGFERVFPTRRPDTADVSATSCDVGFFFSVSYVVSLPNCRHVVDCLRYILAKIDPKDTVDKLNKSKLTGNVNVNKMVLPLVSCWWCLLTIAKRYNGRWRLATRAPPLE